MVPDGRGAAGGRARTVVERSRGRDGRLRRLGLRRAGGRRDGAQEGGGSDGGGSRRGRTPSRSRASTLGPYRHPGRLEADHDRPVAIRPQHPGAGGRQPIQRCLGRVSVGVPGTRRRNRHTRSGGIHECLRGRGPAAVVGDLEQVDVGQPVLEEGWIDAFLDVAHQQEPPLPDLAEQDDRDVVDAGPAVRRGRRDLPTDRPQHAERDLIDFEPIPGRQAEPRRRPGLREFAQPFGIAGPRTAHPGFEDPSDAVAPQQQRQPGDMVLVRVAQDDGIDATIPRRDPLVELDEQPVGVGPAVDQQPSAA